MKPPDRVTTPNPMSPPTEPAQPRTLSRGTIVLWLIVVGLGILFIPLSLISSTIRDDVKGLQSDLDSVQQSLTSVPTPAPEVQALMSTLSVVQSQTNQIQAVYPTVVAARTNWPAVMAAIGNYNPDQIALTSLTQSDIQITLSGRASDEGVVVAYARGLEQSGLFSRVVVQSIRVVATPFVTPTSTVVLTPTATVTPTATSTPTATPTPTTNPRDDYEPDDTQPKPIVLGQPQRHNFYPTGDVDRVSFLAKAGRYYRVYTANLAPAVDTFLTVVVGDSTYTNDDVRPGDLSSQVSFQNTTGSDLVAVVTVTNRGQYGSDKTYDLVAEEVIPASTSTPTPTPTNTGVPSATPTNTLAPTNTPLPTNTPTSTPTPTPDLRDPYEPDDVSPKPIAVGEAQSHNFYPVGDVDKVSLFTKAGRRYQILTADLAVGVDTFLSVTLGSKTWVNDDYAPAGSGNFASAVCFEAAIEGTATATIANRTQLYGPDKTYKVSLNEVTAAEMATAPCSSTTPMPAMVKAPGPAMLSASASRLDSGKSGVLVHAGLNKRNLLEPTAVEWVIVVELKAVSP